MADSEGREPEDDRCPWSFDYDYGQVARCAMRVHVGHHHDPRLHGFGGFDDRSHGAARAPGADQ